MELSSILLKVIQKMDGERTINAGLHLLRGKRSGQTLQDVEYYGLKPYFNILPKLSIELFNQAANELRSSDCIKISDESFVYVTKNGEVLLETLSEFQFNGWDFRGRERLFFGRLSLIVQAASHFRVGEKSFMPIQKEREIQLFVKRFVKMHPIDDPTFSKSLQDELRSSIEQSEMSETQKIIFTHRLSGLGISGWTWEQLAAHLKRNVTAVRLLYIESLHRLLSAIETSHNLPILRKIAENIKVTSHLTDSSFKTKQLFEDGYSMPAIAQSRQLKMSTIEDHFVEMAINGASFPLTQFVTEDDIQSVISKIRLLETRRLRILKEEFPTLSYFQLRLILGARTGGEN